MNRDRVINLMLSNISDEALFRRISRDEFYKALGEYTNLLTSKTILGRIQYLIEQKLNEILPK